MDRARIGRAATGKRPSEVEKQFKRRIVVYLFAIALVWIAWKVLSPDAPRPVSSVATIDDTDTPADPLPPAAEIDPAILARVKDGTPAERAYLERPAQVHLLEEAGKLAYGDLEQLGLRTGDWDELEHAPGNHRGTPFSVLGRLEWLEADEVDRLVHYRGQLRDDDDRPWAFQVLVEPWNVEVGDVVRVQGFFLKQYDALQPDGTLLTAPLLVGEELLASAWRIDPVTSLPRGVFDDVHDRDLAQASRPLDSLAFYELLSYVANTADVTADPEREPPEETQPHLLLNNPDYWRGRSVALTGVLLYMKQAPLGVRGENPLGTPFVWQLWVSDTRSGDAGTMLVLTLEKPDVAEGDIVDVDGIFFRRWSFENKANRPRMVAVVPARSVVTFTPAGDAITPVLVRVIVGLVALIVGLVVVGSVRERRSAARARGSRLARKRRLVGAQATPKGDAGPADARGDDGASSDARTAAPLPRADDVTGGGPPSPAG